MPVTGKFSISYLDYDSEITTTSLNVLALSAANYDAQATLRTNMTAAIEAVVLGWLMKTEYGNVNLQNVTGSDNVAAQRELKWLCMYHDSTSLKKYSFEIGTAATAFLDAVDKKHMAIDSGVGAALKAAFEAYALSPTGGAVVLDEVILVGRNN